MAEKKQPYLIINCKVHKEILPDLIEWWLQICKQQNFNDCNAEIFQIESVTADDPDDPFWRQSKVFILGTNTPSIILSATTKEITYCTEKFIKKTIYPKGIYIYRCLSLSTIRIAETNGLFHLLKRMKIQ
jgi:hypothetical protein